MIGNGNKLTTIPLVGWTMRGGMGVSCALYHNSQGGIPGPWGNNWTPSYFTYISVDGGGNPTLHWDNGLTYAFLKNGSAYTPPYGILDTLVSTGSGKFTLTTPARTVYTFGYVSGNAYLSGIADLNGNTLTINHNADTTLSSVVDPAGRTLTYTYSGGRLRSLTDPLSRVWNFTYGAAGGTGTNNLWTIVLPPVNGQTFSLSFGYDANNNLAAQATPRGEVATFGYNTADGSNSLAWAKDAVGSQTTFTYNSASTVIADPNGHTLTHTYAASRLNAVTDALTLSEQDSYDDYNILVSRTDRRGKAWNYSSHFSNNSPVSTSADPLGNTSSATYDSADKVTAATDAVGNKTTNTYDGQENLLTANITSAFNVPGASSPFSATSQSSGYSNGLPTSFTDPLTHPSSVAYDANNWGQPVSATDANQNTTSATYNALGWELTSVDGNQHSTKYTYDAWGRVICVTAPDGTQTTTSYDPDGNVLRVADADANTAAPVLAVHAGGGATVRFSADADFSGSTATYYTTSAVGVSGTLYNAAVNPAVMALYQTERYSSGTFTYTLPGLAANAYYTLRLHFAEIVSGVTAGQRVFNVAVNGAPVLTNFDVFSAAGGANQAVVEEFLAQANAGGQIVVTFSPGTSAPGVVYTAPIVSGLEVTPIAHTVANAYDADDRLIDTLDGTGHISGYVYDGTDPTNSSITQKGLLSAKIDGNGHTTRYSYTVRNEPSATFYADTTSESVLYDPNGNVVSRTKADGSVINYTYDADNRLTDITYPHPNTPNVHFDYDADSRRTHMHDGAGDTYWTYGDGLHLTQVVTPYAGGGSQTVLYGYDLDGRRTALTLSGLGNWTYGYDPVSRLTSLGNPYSETATFSYDAADRLTRQINGDQTYTNFGYDVADQTTDLWYYNSGNSAQGHFQYGHDPAGNLQTLTENGAGTTTYAYDGDDQLTGETRAGDSSAYALGFSYDGNGNRLAQTQSGSVIQSFTYDAHDKLTSGLGETDSYDGNGNLTQVSIGGNVYTYTWDDEDRLISQSGPGGTSAFTYNGLGLRVSKTDSTGAYAYVCDGTSPGSDVLADGYAVYTPGLSDHRGGVSTFNHEDDLGNLRFLTGSSQSVTGSLLSSAFGSPVSQSGTIATPFTWNGGSGYQGDADGLRLVGHRYYDSRTGRFISQDPAGDGDNWYAYCDNSPVNATDPTGLFQQFFLPTDDTAMHQGLMDAMAGMGDDNWQESLVTWTRTVTSQKLLVGGEDQWVPVSATDWQITSIEPIFGGNMFAGGPLRPGPDGSKYRFDMGEQPKPDMHIYHNGDPKGPETNIDHEGKLRVGEHRGRILKEIPKKLKASYRPIIKTFLERAGMVGDALETALDSLTLDVPIVVFYDPRLLYQKVDSQYSE